MVETLALAQKAQATAARARRSGALAPIRTRCVRVPDGGVEFIVRVVDSLARKQAVAPPTNAQDNPFLPYDPTLFVADVPDTHVVLLNKFPVVEPHLLIVTRAFEEQESAINAADFAALWQCLREFDGLGFYNAGRVAGASQRHKHLQLVPARLADDDSPLPLESALERGVTLPFRHAWQRLPPQPSSAQLAQQYEDLLSALGQSGAARYLAYNLLVTRRWMMAVPRREETYEGITINALGFAGALLARNEQDRQRIERAGPMSILARVAG